jgi:hypothetical protein
LEVDAVSRLAGQWCLYLHMKTEMRMKRYWLRKKPYYED